jgi:peptide/nickel transport system permease protein
MPRFVLSRIAIMILIMVAVSMILFLLLEFSPGSIATKVLGQFSSQEQREFWLEEHGYNRPMHVRYFSWLGRFVTGDLGESIRFKAPVTEILGTRLKATAILAGVTFILMVPLSLFIGIIAGISQGSILDRYISTGMTISTSIPEFASSVFLSAIFVFWLGWFPGTASMNAGFNWVSLILPVCVLLLVMVGYVARMTRASMITIMNSQYIRTAILKGLPMYRVVLAHAVPNALITPFTVIMLQIPWLFSGVIIVEYFFAYKGFGALILDAALWQDVFLLEACTMVTVFIVVTTQTISDIGYTYLNPQIRFK